MGHEHHFSIEYDTIQERENVLIAKTRSDTLVLIIVNSETSS
jgi:hypothetical protein